MNQNEQSKTGQNLPSKTVDTLVGFRQEGPLSFQRGIVRDYLSKDQQFSYRTRERGPNESIGEYEKRKSGVVEDLIEVLTGSAKDVGFNKPIPQRDMIRLTEFVLRQFAYLTYEDIKRAFELTILGELPGVDAKTYGSFSLNFLVGILKAYGSHRSKVLLSLPQPEEKPSAELIEAKEREFRDYVGNVYTEWRDGTRRELPTSLFNPAVYDFLKELDLLNFDKDVKKLIRGRAESKREAVLNKNLYNKGEGAKYVKTSLTREFEDYAKHYQNAEEIRQAFRDLKEFDIDLKEKIKERWG